LPIALLLLLLQGHGLCIQEGQTALWIAACEGHAPCVGLLLGAGAAVDQADNVSAGSVCWCVQPASAKLCAMQTQDGWTPLMAASRWGKKPCTELLIDKGANPAAVPTVSVFA
jgi:ankyrin repeat protein